MKLFKKAHYEKLIGIKEDELEKSAIASAANMGEARDLWHPEHGWLLRDGKLTEIGVKFFEKYYPGS